MSPTGALAVVILAWVTIGIIAGLVMGRRGHSWFTWAALGAVLGPLVIPLAVGSIRREHETHAVTLARGDRTAGPLQVVAGIDGSAAAHAALTSAIDLLGDRLGALTLAAVIDYDTALSNRPGEERDRAVADLATSAAVAAERLGRAPETVLLTGKPVTALIDHAIASGAHLLVIGSRGQGATKAVLGSAATHLARTHHSRYSSCPACRRQTGADPLNRVNAFPQFVVATTLPRARPSPT